MIHRGVLGCGFLSVSSQHKGPQFLQDPRVLTGHACWQGRDGGGGRSRAGQRVLGAEWSLLIPYFVLDPLESACLYKYTLLQPTSLFKTPSPFLPHPSILRPHRGPVTGTVFILFFKTTLFVFQNKRLIEWCGKCECVCVGSRFCSC